MAGCRWEKSRFRNYSFPTEPIPRLQPSDSRVDELISQGKPVIIENANVVQSAMKWDLDYLHEHMHGDAFSVYESDSHLFKYYDEKKTNVLRDFVPSMKRKEMTFPQFVKELNLWKPGKKKLYLQQALNDTVGPIITRDFKQFRWDWVMRQKDRNHWGELTSNLLLVGQEGNVTPCHYDEQENFFTQVKGHKRVILFPPSMFNCLYPYPVYHPHDRQSQVNFDAPDFDSFPRFRDVRGLEAVLSPGDLLYLPMYWWHHFESMIDGGYTLSITFWCKAAATGKIVYPLKPQQKVAMKRNIEKMIISALGDPKEVDPFMRDMILGRYTPHTS